MANAVRGPHVQDTSVLERRLRPIYDWLDAANYKKAIQECDKVLKKTAQLQRVQALKALALLRMGKEADAELLLAAIAAHTPTEDATLQVMSMCYREMQQMDRVCELYEAAVRVDVGNEELHTHLFMAYVRTSNFKAQQQAAMTLYKLQPKKPYYCWAIMSIILQAERGEGAHDAKKRHLLLTLAERMIDKVLAEQRMAAEPVALYVMVLDALGKHAKIVDDVLNGPYGASLVGEVAVDATPYLIKLERWAALNSACKRQLRTAMDRWDVWQHYVQSVIALAAEPRPPDHLEHLEPAPDATLDRALTFIDDLIQQSADTGYALRGPFLARFELAKHQQLEEDTITELFVAYFTRFGHKACCVADLRDYLQLLAPGARVALSGRLLRVVGVSAVCVPASARQMQSHIGALQMARLCGAHAQLTDAHAMALVTTLAFHYAHGRETFGGGVLRTEPHAADAYVLLAAHTLFDVHVRTTSARPLVVALVLLHHALAHSPHNSHVKLLMVRLYHALGDVAAANAVHDTLEVKHLQLDSMCHVHTAHVPASGHYALAHHLADTTLKFFAANCRDSSEHLTYAYKFGSFRKVGEFMALRERMQHSFHYASIAVEKAFLNLAACATSEACYALEPIPTDQPVVWEALRNNSDLSVFVSWDPARINAPLETWPQNVTIYAQDVALLKMRVAVMHCIECALTLCKSHQHEKQMEVVLPRLEALRVDEVKPVAQDSLGVNTPSLLHVYARTAYHTIAVNAFRLVAAVDAGDVEMALKAVDGAAAACDTCATCVLDRLQPATPNGRNTQQIDAYLNNRCDIHYVCIFIEIISVLTLALLVSGHLQRPHVQRKRRQQTTTEENDDGRLHEPIAHLVSDVCAHVRRVDAALDVLLLLTPAAVDGDGDAVVADVIDKLATLQISTDNEREVLADVRRSNETAVKEMRAILRAKLKLLTSCGWTACS